MTPRDAYHAMRSTTRRVLDATPFDLTSDPPSESIFARAARREWSRRVVSRLALVEMAAEILRLEPDDHDLAGILAARYEGYAVPARPLQPHLHDLALAVGRFAEAGKVAPP